MTPARLLQARTERVGVRVLIVFPRVKQMKCCTENTSAGLRFKPLDKRTVPAGRCAGARSNTLGTCGSARRFLPTFGLGNAANVRSALSPSTDIARVGRHACSVPNIRLGDIVLDHS